MPIARMFARTNRHHTLFSISDRYIKTLHFVLCESFREQAWLWDALIPKKKPLANAALNKLAPHIGAPHAFVLAV